MTRARKQPVDDLEKRCLGDNPGRRAVRGTAQAVAAVKKRLPRTRVEGWDECFVVGLAFALAVIVVVAMIYQTVGWARS